MEEFDEDIIQFNLVIENINKGNYGKITDDALLGDNADFNDSLGVLGNLEQMNATLENMKKKETQFVIELEDIGPLVFAYTMDDPIFNLKEGISELEVSNVSLDTRKCNCCA